MPATTPVSMVVSAATTPLLPPFAHALPGLLPGFLRQLLLPCLLEPVDPGALITLPILVCSRLAADLFRLAPVILNIPLITLFAFGLLRRCPLQRRSLRSCI
jgi:hypothetical protein